jgi:Predicted membrane-bound mannosyltransferase
VDDAALPSRSSIGRRLLIGAAVVAIVLGGAAARFTDLAANPGGLYPDEAAEALSGRQILDDPAYRPVFIPENGGREALFAYTVAAGFAVGGETVLTLRTVAVIWGVLGILGAWLLGRRFGVGAGLAAAAWIAGSLWLIAISRDGMRNTIVPVFGALALFALLAWQGRPSRRMAAVAGATLAIAALYTYQPLKLLPVLALLWVLWLRRADREAYRRLRGGFPAFIVAFVIAAAPMIAAAIANPQAYLGRAIGVTPFNPGFVPPTDLVTHVLRTLGMFTFVGDPNARHDVAGLPLLGWAVAVLALAGIVVLWRGRARPSHALVLLSLPVFLIAPLIATEGGSPHFLRALGLAAPLAVTVGLGAQDLAMRLRAAISGRMPSIDVARPWASRAIAAGAFVVLFAALGLGSASTYLGRPPADRYAPFSGNLVAMAGLVLGPTDAVILDDFSALTVRFLTDDAPPTFVEPGIPVPAAGVDRVLAVSTEALQAAVGPQLSAGAAAVAWDPAGQPTVWAVTLR